MPISTLQLIEIKLRDRCSLVNLLQNIFSQEHIWKVTSESFIHFLDIVPGHQSKKVILPGVAFSSKDAYYKTIIPKTIIIIITAVLL